MVVNKIRLLIFCYLCKKTKLETAQTAQSVDIK